MRYPCYFADGPVTDRLLGVIRERSAKEIIDLIHSQKFRIFADAKIVYNITSNNLLPEYVSDYVLGTDYTLHDVFYGLDAPVDPACTPYDNTILELLDLISDEVLEKLFVHIQSVYPNSFFNVGRDLSPNHKLKQVFSRLPRGALTIGNKSFNHPGNAGLSDRTKADLAVFTKNHCYPWYTFDVNCMPEYASFVGISLHWIWNLPQPLYSKSQIADNIYDFFTMMQPEDQKELIYILTMYYEDRENQENQN